MVGDDEFGHLLFRICDELGIKRDMLEMRPGIATSLTLAMTPQDTGKRTFFHNPGALALQSPDDFDFSHTQARILHMGLPGLHAILDAPWKGEASGWVTVLKKARAAGLQTNMELVSIEPQKIRATAETFLPFLDMLVINDEEVGAIAGVETVPGGKTDAAAVRIAAATIMQRFPLQLIAVHYPLGGLVLTRGGETAEHPSVNVPVAEVKGSNGAGDCFAAGILIGQHEGWPILQILEIGPRGGGHVTALNNHHGGSRELAGLPQPKPKNGAGGTSPWGDDQDDAADRYCPSPDDRPAPGQPAERCPPAPGR